MNDAQKEMAEKTNKNRQTGPLSEIIKGKDVFIGVSAPNIVTAEMVSEMADNAVIFAHGKSNSGNHAGMRRKKAARR